MTIEARAYFLGIPISPKFELQPGEMLPGDVCWDVKGLAGAIFSTMIWDTGIGAFCSFNPGRSIQVLNTETVVCERRGQRVVASGAEINREGLRSPTMVPGVTIKVGYTKNLPVINLGKGQYKIL